jgi:hypothetical protein
VTLNGAVTVILGAAVSVEPVTPTLPVAPLSVHSGVPPPPGAWLGQLLSAAAGWVGAGDMGPVKAGTLIEADDALGDGLSELHAASIMTADPAQAARASGEVIRKEFTVATLHPRSRNRIAGPKEVSNVRARAIHRPEVIAT